MPYKHIEKKIPRELDRRVKLTQEQREEIRLKYAAGDCSQRSLGKEYGVSKTTIRFIVDPAQLKRHTELAAARRKDGRYYDRAAHTKNMREHRRYKESIKDQLTK